MAVVMNNCSPRMESNLLLKSQHSASIPDVCSHEIYTMATSDQEPGQGTVLKATDVFGKYKTGNDSSTEHNQKYKSCAHLPPDSQMKKQNLCLEADESNSCLPSDITERYSESYLFSETDKAGNCMPSVAASDAIDVRLSIREEKITLVTAQAMLARQNSLRLVSRSPKVSKRSIAMNEFDRTWALDQCEELTTWVNSLLQLSGKTLQSDLKKAIGDGHTLSLIVSIISEDFEVPENPAKSQQERFERARSCIEHLKSLGYACAEVTAIDLVNGDLKSVILFLSGLKSFYEEERKPPSNNMNTGYSCRSPGIRRRTPSRERALAQQVGVVPNQPQQDFTRALAPAPPRMSAANAPASSSVSDKLKRLLKDDQSTGVNVDSGEKDKSNMRDQPSGESDSAASPNSNHDDNSHRANHNGYYSERANHNGYYSEQQMCQGIQPLTVYQMATDQSRLPRYSLPAVQTLPHTHRPQDPPLYNSSVPNLHAYSKEGRPPRSMTPTPTGNKLSVYGDRTLANYTPPETHNFHDNAYIDPNHHRTLVGESNYGTHNGYNGTATIHHQADRPEIYPPVNISQSPYNRRKQLQVQPTNHRHYETIDEVKFQPINGDYHIQPENRVSDPNQPHTVISRDTQRPADLRVGSRPNQSHSTGSSPRQPNAPNHSTVRRTAASSKYDKPLPSSQMNKNVPNGDSIDVELDGIPPDVKYDTSPRRVSMPAVRYSHRNSSTKQPRPTSRQRAPVMVESLEVYIPKSENYDSDDYVDISENEKDEPKRDNSNQERLSTPPLPTLGSISDSESEGSESETEPTYKYKRSVSASPKMLSAGVDRFQKTLRQSKEQGKYRSSHIVEEEEEEECPAGRAENERRPITPVRREQKGLVRPTTHQPASDSQTGGTTHIANQSEGRRQSPVGVVSQTDHQHIRVSNNHHSKDSRRHRDGSEVEEIYHSNNKTERLCEGRIDKKVQKLERLYEDMSNYLNVSRQPSHRRRDTRRHSIASATSSQYSHSNRHRKSSRTSSDTKAIHKRFQRLEAHIVTIAKSVSHLSSEIQTQNSVYSEIDRISSELDLLKQQIQYHCDSGGTPLPLGDGAQYPHPRLVSPEEPNSEILRETGPQKISKLTRLRSTIRRRFFGQEPPLMKIFLKQLGYEKYQSVFDTEKIGMLELPYMSEERLRVIGIPLGPRARILQEASRLFPQVTQHRSQAMGTITAPSVRHKKHA